MAQPRRVNIKTLPHLSLAPAAEPEVQYPKTDPSLARLVPQPTKLTPPTTMPVEGPKAPNAQGLYFTNDVAGMDNSVFGGSPPDPGGIAGMTQYVQTVNESMAVYDKSMPTPNLLWETTLSDFFGTSVFDPHVTLDYYSKRFLVVGDDGTNLHVGVSTGTSATGSWCTYTFGGLNSNNPSGLADYPLIAMDGPGGELYMSIVEFSSKTNGSFVGNRMIIASRDDLENCAGVQTGYYENLTFPGTNDLVPVITPVTDTTASPVATAAYWVASRAFSGGSGITLFKYYEYCPSCGLAAWTLPSINYAPPPTAPQEGSSATIETLDNRIYQATENESGPSSFITFALPSSCTFDNSQTWVSCIEWFELYPNEASSELTSNIVGYGSGWWAFFPSVAYDNNLNVVFNFTISGYSYYPSASSFVHGIDGYSGTYTQGYGIYTYATGNPSRWGDFSAVFMDPNGLNPGRTFWLDGETTIATNRWGTHISGFQTTG